MNTVQERGTILLVDDQSEDRAQLRQLLSPEYEIVEAADGNEGIQMMETYCLQLAAVLLDVDMPGLDGFEVLQIARQKGWLRAVPVFLIAEERAEEVLERGYELGAMDILTKPFWPQVVRRRVDSMVELYRHRYELEQAVEDIKRESRRYAKRQITWFAREENAVPLFLDEVDGPEGLLAAAGRVLDGKGLGSPA